MNRILIASLLLIQSLALADTSLILDAVEESKYDTIITCHPAKVKESEYRTFGLRLRETKSGVKMVSKSVYVYSPHPFLAKEYFNTLELNPSLNVSDSSIEILSGEPEQQVYAALGIYTTENSMIWTGRLQLWWPNQTESYTTKVICSLSTENSVSSPVIP